VTLRVGMVGLGSIHPAHLAGYQRIPAEVSLVAVCDADPDKAATVAATIAAEPFTDYNELFASGRVDAVDILLPHYLHVSAATAAIEAGLHVLLEKPAAPTAREVADLERSASEQGVILAVAENTRFVQAYNVVAEILGAGTIGNVEVVRTLVCGNATDRLRTVSDWKGRKDGTLGGVIYDSGAHSFYLLEWLFGGATELRSIASMRIAESEVEDFAVVVGKVANGADFLTEYTFTAEIPWSERLEVFGSHGSVIVDQLADPVVKLFKSKGDWTGSPAGEVPFQPADWKRNSIAEEVIDFVRAINHRRPHAVSLDHVQATMLAIEAAYASLAADSARIVIPTRT
jgi:predicted dehydrogenase